MDLRDYTHTEIINGRPCSYNKLYRDKLATIDSALLSDESPETQEKVLNWIKENLYPRKTPLWECTSYGLKHALANDTGIYLTHNAFKDAMLKCGFEPHDSKEFNWVFGISKKSPVFTKNNPPRGRRY